MSTGLPPGLEGAPMAVGGRGRPTLPGAPCHGSSGRSRVRGGLSTSLLLYGQGAAGRLGARLLADA